MNPIDKHALYDAIRWRNGDQAVALKLAEECSELAAAITKAIIESGPLDADAIIDEMADAHVTFGQVALMIGDEGRRRLQERIEYKLDRLKGRMA